MVVCYTLISLNPISEGGSGNDPDGDSDVEADRIQIQLSVKEFLMSSRGDPWIESGANLSSIHRGGVSTLFMTPFHPGPLRQRSVKDYPSALYAAQHWWQHIWATIGVLSLSINISL